MPDRVYKTSEKARARMRKRYHEDEDFRNYWKEYAKRYKRDNRKSLTAQGHEWRLKTKYGMTRNQRDRLLESQNNRCNICGIDIRFIDVRGGAAAKHAAHVDHCHATNRVRGILCRGCNLGLGHFADDAGRLRAAANYLGCEPPEMPADHLPQDRQILSAPAVDVDTNADKA